MINFEKAMESGTPPSMSDITAERDILSGALKKYKVRAIALLGITILSSMAVILYLDAHLSESMDMVILNIVVFIAFIVAMTLHKMSEQKANIHALEPYVDLEELHEIKNKSAQVDGYLTQIKDRDVVFGEVSLMKRLILEEEKTNAAEAKKQKAQALRKKYMADK